MNECMKNQKADGVCVGDKSVCIHVHIGRVSIHRVSIRHKQKHQKQEPSTP